MHFGIMYWIIYGVGLPRVKLPIRTLYFGKSVLAALLVVFAWCFFLGSQPKPSLNAHRHQTIHLKPFHQTIRYQAKVTTPSTDTLSSPIGGYIHSIQKHIGESVKQGDAILVIDSPETKKLFIDTFVSYLKAKEQLFSQRKKFKNTQLLYKSDIISADEYSQNQNQLHSQEVDHIQLQYRLKTICSHLQIPWKLVANISLKDTDFFQNMLNKESKVTLYSPNSGLLIPVKDRHTSQDNMFTEGKKIEPGSLIAMVGKPEQVALHLKISGQDIDKIRVGQKAIINPLSGHKRVMGYVHAVHRYHVIDAGNDDESTFPVIIYADCPSTTCPLNIGLNATIDIITESLAQTATIPFSAVHYLDNKAYVMRRNNQGVFVKHPIRVNRSLSSGLLVDQGLASGDIIEQHYPMPKSL